MRASPKPVATATAIILLVDRGKIDFEEKVSHYLPAFAARGKSAITIRQLLVHVSGLPAETPVADYALGRPQVQKRIAALGVNNTGAWILRS